MTLNLDSSVGEELVQLHADVFLLNENIQAKKRTVDSLQRDINEAENTQKSKKRKINQLQREKVMEDLFSLPSRDPAGWKLYVEKYEARENKCWVCENIERTQEEHKAETLKDNPWQRFLTPHPLEPFEVTDADKLREKRYWSYSEPELRLLFDWALKMFNDPRIRSGLELSIHDGLWNRLEFQTTNSDLDKFFEIERKKLDVNDPGVSRMISYSTTHITALYMERCGPPCSYSDYIEFVKKLRHPDHFVNKLS